MRVGLGPGILGPSLRPQGAWWVVGGDRLGDPDWAAKKERFKDDEAANALLSRPQRCPYAIG
jgi:hypothetical protein